MHNYIERWQEHIRVLAEEIGGRGPTSEAEREASEYCRRVLADLGYEPEVEPFTGIASTYPFFLYAAIGMLVSFTLYPLFGRFSAFLAALAAGFVMLSIMQDFNFRPNILRKLIRTGESQNVVAHVEPSGEHQRDVILIGHVDTHQTPFFFRHPTLVDGWRIYAMLTFMLFIAQAVLYIAGLLTGWAWIWWASIPSAVCALLLAGISIHASATPLSPGANDNATGAGLVLTLAEYLASNPLEHTRVWLVCTGCEEVKHAGSIAFFEKHREAFHNPSTVVFEMLGRDTPGWMAREGMIPAFSTYPDADMAALCEQIAARRPEWGIGPTRVTGGNTEMADALRVGIPAITLIGIGNESLHFGYRGPELYWHRPDDTADKIRPEFLERAYVFARDLVHALDKPEQVGVTR